MPTDKRIVIRLPPEVDVYMEDGGSYLIKTDSPVTVDDSRLVKDQYGRLDIVSNKEATSIRVGDRIRVTGVIEDSLHAWCKDVVGSTGKVISIRFCDRNNSCGACPNDWVIYRVDFDNYGDGNYPMCYNKFELLDKPKVIVKPKLRKSHKVT